MQVCPHRRTPKSGTVTSEFPEILIKNAFSIKKLGKLVSLKISFVMPQTFLTKTSFQNKKVRRRMPLIGNAFSLTILR